MQLSTILLFATSALAAPSVPRADANTVSAMAAVPEWTIVNFTRTCNKTDTECVVSFAVDTHVSPVTACSYKVTGAPASRTSTNGIVCGPYTLSSGWSGQFGPNNGFTTWSLVDWSKKLIAWPAYSDAELVNGVAVAPNKSYAPQNL